MRFLSSKRRRRILPALAVLLILYSAGYAICRMNKTIAHYTAAAGGRCSFHGVAAGDYKIASAAPALEATPIRYAELAYWEDC